MLFLCGYTVIGSFLTGLDQTGNNLPAYCIQEEAFGSCGLMARSGLCGAGFAAWVRHALFGKENRFACDCMLDTFLRTGSIIRATICFWTALTTWQASGRGLSVIRLRPE